MEQISNNFKISEFGKSVTATRRKIDNTIPDTAKPNIEALVLNLLQPICDATGWHNLITSGYRSEKLNKFVGGSSTSQHLKGEASDNKFYTYINSRKVWVSSFAVTQKVIELKLDFDQMILYPNFVHLSYTTTRKNRRQVLYSKSYTGQKI